MKSRIGTDDVIQGRFRAGCPVGGQRQGGPDGSQEVDQTGDHDVASHPLIGRRADGSGSAITTPLGKTGGGKTARASVARGAWWPTSDDSLAGYRLTADHSRS